MNIKILFLTLIFLNLNSFDFVRYNVLKEDRNEQKEIQIYYWQIVNSKKILFCLPFKSSKKRKFHHLTIKLQRVISQADLIRSIKENLSRQGIFNIKDGELTFNASVRRRFSREYDKVEINYDFDKNMDLDLVQRITISQFKR